MKLRHLIASAAILLIACAVAAQAPTRPKRHTSPIENSSTVTQAINETRGDTARINAARRAASTHYHRDDGYTVYVDTITGEEWVDSTAVIKVVKMKYPLLMGVSVGVNIWDPVMRLFGQKHGLVGFSADVNMHNRYFPALEIGLGTARNTPAASNYTYRSPMSVYFKLGADYNFLYNSNPDYQWLAGFRYGFAPFSWAVDDISLAPGYWDDPVTFAIPSQNATAGWLEFQIGLRIKLFGNLSAGWMVRYHTIIHESKNVHGQPWYIPGFGTRGQAISGAFTFTYTLPLNKRSPETVLQTGVSTYDEPLPAPDDSAGISRTPVTE